MTDLILPPDAYNDEHPYFPPPTPDVEEPQQQTPGGFVPNATPCQIHTTFDKTFVVDDVEAWGYVPQGIFATGHWKGRTGQTDVVIPTHSVAYIELDFGRLEKFIAEQQQAVSDESPST